MDSATSTHLQADPAFQELVRTRGRLGWGLTFAMLVIYFGFLGLVAFAPHVMATPVLGIITLGFPLGLGVIVIAIVLTGIYVFEANRRFDALTRRIVAGRR
jgi:uncharacterized membrane protein (DUF485 family)